MSNRDCPFLPGIEIIRLYAHEGRAVGRTGTAQHLTARHIDPPTVGLEERFRIDSASWPSGLWSSFE